MCTGTVIPTTPLPRRMVANFRARVRRLAERHIDLATRNLMQKLVVLSVDTAAAIERACEASGTCSRVVRSAYQALSLEGGPADDSVGRMAQLLVLAQLREHTRGVAAESDSMRPPTAAELRAGACLRLHRAAALLLLKELKTAVWTSVIRGALLETEVLLLESGEELTTLDRGQLVRELEEARQGMCDEDDCTRSLPVVAEMVALEQLLRSLPGEPEVPMLFLPRS